MSHMNKGQYCARVWLLLAIVWKFRGFCSQECITYKIQRSEDKWPSCLQMQHVGFFSSTLCVCKGQLANSDYNSCIVWKECSRPHSGTLEMSLNMAFALTHANWSLSTNPVYTSEYTLNFTGCAPMIFLLKPLKLCLVALPPTVWEWLYSSLYQELKILCRVSSKLWCFDCEVLLLSLTSWFKVTCQLPARLSRSSMCTMRPTSSEKMSSVNNVLV